MSSPVSLPPKIKSGQTPCLLILRVPASSLKFSRRGLHFELPLGQFLPQGSFCLRAELVIA